MIEIIKKVLTTCLLVGSASASLNQVLNTYKTYLEVKQLRLKTKKAKHKRKH